MKGWTSDVFPIRQGYFALPSQPSQMYMRAIRYVDDAELEGLDSTEDISFKSLAILIESDDPYKIEYQPQHLPSTFPSKFGYICVEVYQYDGTDAGRETWLGGRSHKEADMTGQFEPMIQLDHDKLITMTFDASPSAGVE